MASMEERLKVLKMVQEGKLSADQASELLSMLDAPSTKAPVAPLMPPAPGRGKFLRVRVTDSTNGRVRVNVRLPVSMVNAGMKMGMRFTPEVEGLNIEDLAQFIASGEVGQIVDVMDEVDGEHVEVFIE
jgi:hypothetical protein